MFDSESFILLGPPYGAYSSSGDIKREEGREEGSMWKCKARTTGCKDCSVWRETQGRASSASYRLSSILPVATLRISILSYKCWVCFCPFLFHFEASLMRLYYLVSETSTYQNLIDLYTTRPALKRRLYDRVLILPHSESSHKRYWKAYTFAQCPDPSGCIFD